MRCLRLNSQRFVSSQIGDGSSGSSNTRSTPVSVIISGGGVLSGVQSIALGGVRLFAVPLLFLMGEDMGSPFILHHLHRLVVMDAREAGLTR